MLISDTFPDGRSLMFFNALIQVSACVADVIIRIEIQSNKKYVSTRLWGVNPTNSVFIPQSHVLRSNALD